MARGKKIADLRMLVGWSQRELASRAGITLRSLSDIESGHGSTLDFYKVAEALNVHPDELWKPE